MALHRNALRTAALSTLVVAVVLVVLMAGVDVLFSRNLTAGVDDQLRDQLGRPIASGVFSSHGGDTDYDEPTLHWIVGRDGNVQAAIGTPALPQSLRSLTGFSNATIAGGQFRVAGEPTAGGFDIVARSMAGINNAMTTVLVSELIVGPLLLVLVFMGAFVIGRRVATPVEIMRQRQLDFTADASHELRTPLSVIRAETSLLQEDAKGETRMSLERIAGETQRMRDIVDDLLWLARFDTEPNAPSGEAVDLAAVAGVAVERFHTVAAERSITLRQNVAGDELQVYAPPEWIDRLAGVLVDNACRYSREGTEVTVSVSRAGGRVRMSVADSGPGVPAGQASRMLERFARGTSEGEGAGLGLAIADSVVRATGGKWEIANRPGGGAEFAVSWRG